MRPGQNNKRMRGRNNNRKGPSPLSRTYESNGPDVKIRGTAQHVAEKYLQLARDAQSSGDPVAAENLLQHAEHYFRLIAAAQTQLQPQYGRNGEELDEGDDDDDFVALPDRFASPLERAPQIPPVQQPQQNGGQMNYGAQPQPYFERPAFNTEGNERPVERPERQDRNFDRGANPNGERQDRQPRNDRRFGQQAERTGSDRPQGQGQGRNRFRDQQPRFDASTSGQEQPRVDFEPLTTALPAFITTPTRVPAPPSPQPEDVDAFPVQSPLSSLPAPTETPENVAAPGDDDGENRFHLRPRRRRRPRADSAEGGDATPQPETSSAD
jgi:hypothetical protein